ncbi:MAG: S1C family serine protease [Pirellulaceae bacterium]
MLLFALVTFSTVSNANENELARNSLLEVQRRVQAVVTQVMPSVVSISDGVGFGSGVVIDEDGLILTAGHVVSGGASEFDIFFPSGQTTTAKLVGYNLDVDAAMLKITEGSKWPAAELAASGGRRLGDWVVGLGHSGGYELGRIPPVRTGRLLEVRKHLLVTDAVLIGGDSGGPLFDLEGKVIGIHSSIGDSIAENRHVSIETFRNDWQRLFRGERWGDLPNFTTDKELEEEVSPNKVPKRSSRAKLGIKLDDNQSTAIIIGVDSGSVAERVGIKAGDVVVSFDGVKVKGKAHMFDLVSQKAVGDSVAIEISRRGQLLKLQVILDSFRD